MRRVAFLGGSFDPVHNGHLHVASAARSHFDLAAVHFLPAPCPPHKRSQRMTDIDDRLALLRLALSDEPTFVIDDAEVRRGGTSYTYDTLCEKREVLGEDVEVCFVIGGDSLRDLPKWYRAEDLVREFTLITVPRDPDASLDELLGPAAAALPAADVDRLRRHVLPVEPLPISSTEIRALCRAGDVDEAELSRLVPSAVARAIVERGLYAT